MSVGGLIWPDYVAVEADGYAVADDSNVARTPFDDGFIRQERRFASALTAPVIGIGAGPDVDGQILVLYDALGITRGKTPRFVRNFMTGQDSPLAGLERYVRAVKEREYPAEEHCFA